MKKLFIIFVVSCLFYACNDGDIIVTEFDFDESSLNNCGALGEYTFFNINNSSAAESISLNLITTDILFLESSVREFQLNSSSNTVNYRKYNDDVSSDYFCNNIPPLSPDVTLEFLGESGIAVLTTTVTKLDNDGLDDEVITSDLDTDGDGLLNYFDEDDDGDNVPTIIELGLDYINGITDEPRDTDKDGIPDYLDKDDDADGVLTRYEDANGDLDPTNDETVEGIPDYLNDAISITDSINQYRLHSYSFISDISLVLKDLVLINSEEEIIQETLNMGSQNNVINTTITEAPEFPEL